MLKINETRFRAMGVIRNCWEVNAEPNMTPEDLLKPNTWGNVASRLRPFDRITVAADDGSWWAEYLVIDTEALSARVKLINKLIIDDTEEEPATRDAEFELKYRGTKKWSVMRKADGAVMRDGFAEKDEAQAYLAGHLKTLAA